MASENFEGFGNAVDPTERTGKCGIPSCVNQLDEYDCHEFCMVHRPCISKSSLSIRPAKCLFCESMSNSDDQRFFEKTHNVITVWRKLNGCVDRVGIKDRLSQRNYVTPFLSDEEISVELRKRVREERSGQSKVPSVSFTLSDISNKDGKLPKDHKFILRSKETLLGVLSQTGANVDSGSENEKEKVFMEGHVIQKFECQPVVDANYLALKREVMQKASLPLRQVVKIDHPAPTYTPRSIPEYVKRMQEKKKAEGKKARDDWEKVQEMLFAAFEKHQYYNIKDLQKLTRQPITYLKEILKEMCDYNVKNPHKNMWELKPEYRHYKQDKEKQAEQANDSE